MPSEKGLGVLGDRPAPCFGTIKARRLDLPFSYPSDVTIKDLENERCIGDLRLLFRG